MQWWLLFVEQSNEASKTNSEKIPHIVGHLNSLDAKKQRRGLLFFQKSPFVWHYLWKTNFSNAHNFKLFETATKIFARVLNMFFPWIMSQSRHTCSQSGLVLTQFDRFLLIEPCRKGVPRCAY